MDQSHLPIYLFSYLETLLVNLKEIDEGRVFHDMVSIDHYPSYYQIIKTPMCINLIHLKLRKFEYCTLSSFIYDLNLIWENCRLFNKDNSPICNLVDRLEGYSNKYISEYNLYFLSIKKRLISEEETVFVEEDVLSSNERIKLYEMLINKSIGFKTILYFLEKLPFYIKEYKNNKKYEVCIKINQIKKREYKDLLEYLSKKGYI